MHISIFTIGIFVIFQHITPLNKSFNILTYKRLSTIQNDEQNSNVIENKQIESTKKLYSAKEIIIQQKYDDYLFQLHLKNIEKNENEKYFKQGIILGKQGNYSQALSKLMLVTKKSPRYSTVAKLIIEYKEKCRIEEINNKRFGIWIKSFKECNNHSNHACNGSAFCNKCTNCSRCSHCKTHGGRCGVCRKS
jgi:hypothetical protein